MNVQCEYCGSYVEVAENCTCPNCCAPLGNAVKRAEEQAKAQAQAQAAAEVEAAEKQQSQQNKENLVKLVGGVLLGSMVSGRNRRPMGGPGGFGGPGSHSGPGGFGGPGGRR